MPHGDGGMEDSFQIGLAIRVADIVKSSYVQGRKVIAILLRAPGGAYYNHRYLSGLMP
jgi:hypothetical protein